MANDRRARVRQAARRRARARGRADAGAPVRDPAAGPARRRRREGRAPGARRVGPGVVARRCSIPQGRKVGATYLRNNFDKRSVGIDLKSPEGRELFLALVPRFDVIAENFKPGTMDRMGLGYADIAAHAPARDLRVDLGLRQHGRDAVPRLAGVRVDRRGDVGDLRLPPSRRAAGDDSGRRARRHQLGACSA